MQDKNYLEIQGLNNNQAKVLLKESEERFSCIFLELPIGIKVYDQKGYLLDVNKAYLAMFAVTDVNKIKKLIYLMILLYLKIRKKIFVKAYQ
ncbi:MAG: hypothetical protein V1872_05275 [bacterium]